MSSRVFLLSPASTGGARARLLFNPAARFDLATRLREGQVDLAEVFAFLSGLYFRGKITYSRRFAPDDAIRLITSDRGLVHPRTLVSLDDLTAMAGVDIHESHPGYRTPMLADALALRAAIPLDADVVLLGSIATPKYADVLLEVFGRRLLFPREFVGRGDMSRGGLLLRHARMGEELEYMAVEGATRRGKRPAKLAPEPRKNTKANSTDHLLPLDYAPMEARAVGEVPTGEGWQYEPKWDGFRCLAFRNGSDVELMSKSGKPLTRYFPDVVELLLALRAKRFVLDGEIVVPEGDALSFDALLQRIHPAASRVAKLSTETPASLILFDLLAEGSKRFVDQPLSKRRVALEVFAAKHLAKVDGRILLSPATRDIEEVAQWFGKVGSDLDGIIAKRIDLPYQSGERTGMVKIKQRHTVDCVVGGFRYAANSKLVGSLLLGLYNDVGKLDHVGFWSSIKDAERPALTKKLKALIAPPGFTGKAPGGPSRWSTERSAEWEPLKPKLVVEVEYDHFTGGRFRHGTTFVRWRPDKAPRQCTYEQLRGASKAS